MNSAARLRGGYLEYRACVLLVIPAPLGRAFSEAHSRDSRPRHDGAPRLGRPHRSVHLEAPDRLERTA